MKKIGLFGGSFNPPHYGHLYIATRAIKFLDLDELWMIPTIQNPFKTSPRSIEERIALCEELAKDHKKIRLMDFGEKTRYSINLVRFLKQKFPHKFIFIMGADNLQSIDKWRRNRELQHEIDFAIIDRGDNFVRFVRESKFINLSETGIYFNQKPNKEQRILIFKGRKVGVSGG